MNVYIAKGGEGMGKTSVRPADEIERILRQYGDALYRLCLAMLGGSHDAEDAVQETLIRFFRKAPVFRDAEHEKAWLITVAANICRDMLRRRARHPQTEMEQIEIPQETVREDGILDALATLPEKYRLVLVLHYVEGYRVEEVAKTIARTPSAVKMRLQKGRRLLEEAYRKEKQQNGDQ